MNTAASTKVVIKRDLICASMASAAQRAAKNFPCRPLHDDRWCLRDASSAEDVSAASPKDEVVQDEIFIKCGCIVTSEMLH